MLLANQDLIIKDHTEWFPNTSFGDRGPTPEWVREEGYYIITVWKPYDHATEKLIPANPHLYDGMCCTVEVAALTEEELQSRVNSQWAAIRSARNELLKDSDWTQLADSPADKAEWAAYRQDLRDVTKQTDPFAVVWPTAPGTQIVSVVPMVVPVDQGSTMTDTVNLG